MAFLKTILIILLVYYLLKFLAKLFAPKILNYAAKKTESHFREAFDNQRPFKQEEEESVIINKKPSRKKNDSEKVGEYIDFEELD
ncbi:DUF4834 domain-containing protein [Maribacter ulvicola]|uniref:DUF4834 domain-containing protein n=1 Tax=Maribacter ulvicola TaxID=228959 RepID=A0A1N6VBJ5_9FLAO|nr:DUF4834 domain-containing protein [Maribacter ulvicola]SIQ75099.1 hypothetical protein SAMN05421797_10363 [Maribacter ulvicola]